MGVYRTGPWSTVEDFIGEIEGLEPYEIGPFFDYRYVGGCPCFTGTKEVAGEEFWVSGRCWRLSEQIEDGYQDLRVGGGLLPKDTIVIAEAIRRKLDEQEWYNPYAIIFIEAARSDNGGNGG